MEIHEVRENRKRYLPLLLLADEQEDMIDRYLPRGWMGEISHRETMLEFETERQIPKLLNADCGMPVGAYSKVQDGKIELIISTIYLIISLP